MEEKFEITAIPNKYKDTLDNLINSSDTESPDQPDSPTRQGLIDKGSHNVLRSKGSSPTLLEEDRLDENILVTLVPKISASQVYQPHDVTPHGPKNEKAQYEILAIDETAPSTKATVKKGLDVSIRKISYINRLI